MSTRRDDFPPCRDSQKGCVTSVAEAIAGFLFNESPCADIIKAHDHEPLHSNYELEKRTPMQRNCQEINYLTMHIAILAD